jgi:hypothetical protein
MKCERCGEVNPAEIHTCTPKHEDIYGCAECGKKQSDGWALYCVKCIEPVREWQGLTDEEKEYFRRLGLVGVEIIEAKLKEKNS